jgi:hypothetical protein
MQVVSRPHRVFSRAFNQLDSDVTDGNDIQLSSVQFPLKHIRWDPPLLVVDAEVRPQCAASRKLKYPLCRIITNRLGWSNA